jgi:signal transduction histidine kinase
MSPAGPAWSASRIASEALGGRMSVERPPGAGTSIHVEFPIADDDRASSG